MTGRAAVISAFGAAVPCAADAICSASQPPIPASDANPRQNAETFRIIVASLFRYGVALQFFRRGLALPSRIALAIEKELSFAHGRIQHPDLGGAAIRDGPRG